MTDQNPDTRAASMAQSGSAPSQSSLADALSTLMGNLTQTSPGAIPQKTGPRTAEEKAQREAFIANLRQIRNNAAAQMKDQYYGRDVRGYGSIKFPFPRYTQEGIDLFGATPETANEQQSEFRGFYGFKGHGDYFNDSLARGGKRVRFDDVQGQGSYFLKSALNWVKKNVVPHVTGVLKSAIVNGGPTVLPMLTGMLAAQPGAGKILAPIAQNLGTAFIEHVKGVEGTGDYLVPDVVTREFFENMSLHPDGVDLLEDVAHMARSGRPVAFNQIAQRNVSESSMHHEMGGSDVKTNSIVNPGAMNSVQRTPIMTSIGENKNGDLMMTFREYIGDVISQGEYFHTNRRIELNPGLAVSFPTLSQFAKYYQYYEFDQLLVEYESEVATGNETAKGVIMIAPQSNPTQYAYPNRASMLNSALSVSSKIEQGLVAGIECDPTKIAGSSKRPFVRTSDMPLEDREDYDFGFVQVALAGVPAEMGVIGSLYIRYTVKLFNMKTEIVNELPVLGGWTYIPQVVYSSETPLGLLGAYGTQIQPIFDPYTLNPSDVNRDSIQQASPELGPVVLRQFANPYLAGPYIPNTILSTNIKFSFPAVSGSVYKLIIRNTRAAVHGKGGGAGQATEAESAMFDIVNRSVTNMGRQVTAVISSSSSTVGLTFEVTDSPSGPNGTRKNAWCVTSAIEVTFTIGTGNSRVAGTMSVDVDVNPVATLGQIAFTRNYFDLQANSGDPTYNAINQIVNSRIQFTRVS